MRGVLLTGLPGVGKSTACSKVMEMCKHRGVQVEGFIVEELREHRTRVGFDVVEICAGAFGKRVPLARIGNDSPKVGKYSVKVQEFESIAFPILDRLSQLPSGENTVCILDEIGKMELFSHGFVSRMRKLLTTKPLPILCTIALHGGGFIAEAKRVPGIDLIEISQETRDAAPVDIISRLLGNSNMGRDAGRKTRELDAPDSFLKGPTQSSGGRRWQKASRQMASEKENNIPISSLNAAGRILLWLRNDLRVADNPLLQRATLLSQKQKSLLIPVFCFDPRVFAPDVRTAFGSLKVGAFRRRFIEESIADLAASFEQLKFPLLIFDGSPEIVLPALAGKGDVVLVARESCPEEVAAENRVKSSLERIGVELEVVDDGGITTIFGAADLAKIGLKAGQAFPEDFREFYDAGKSSVLDICKNGLSSASENQLASCDPVTIPPQIAGLQRIAESCAHSGAQAETIHGSPPIRGGEREALRRLRHWCDEGGLRSYKNTFRHLLGDYSSRLSSHLAFGCISPRRLCVEALQAVRSGQHIEHFIYELCWRDFFRHAAMRWGANLFLLQGPLRSAGGITWRRDTEMEIRWRSGMTGVPLVDAAMRELQATGYIGNLARQFVAAYIVEDLGLDWRIGADWFESTLVDYDPHSNWGQWARSAGVAPTNEGKRRRVGSYRYFDIALQLRDDEAAMYIRTWVPELSDIVDYKVFAPWLCARTLEGYPLSPLCSSSLKKYFEEVARGEQTKGKGGRSKGGKGGKGSFNRR